MEEGRLDREALLLTWHPAMREGGGRWGNHCLQPRGQTVVVLAVGYSFLSSKRSAMVAKQNFGSVLQDDHYNTLISDVSEGGLALASRPGQNFRALAGGTPQIYRNIFHIVLTVT